MKKIEHSEGTATVRRRSFPFHPVPYRIGTRVLLFLLAFSAVIIGILLYLQLDQLDWFYQRNRKNQVKEAANQLILDLSKNSPVLFQDVYDIAQSYDLSILIKDENMVDLCSQSSSRNDLLQRVARRDLAYLWQKVDDNGAPLELYYKIQSLPDGPQIQSNVAKPPFSMIPDSYDLSSDDLMIADAPDESYSGVQTDTGDTAVQDDTTDLLDNGTAFLRQGASPSETDTASDDTSAAGSVSSHVHLTSALSDSDPSVRPWSEADDTSSIIRTYLYVSKVTLPDQSQVLLLLNAEISPLSGARAALRSQLFTVSVIVLVMSVLLSFIVARMISRPIRETSAAARDLSHARFTPPPRANRYREISELNQTLVKAASDLSQVEKLQHELIANISHDLRTPLTMIGGYAEAMRDLPSENTPENMQMIIDETARLSSLVNELLDFSRLQAGVEQLHPSDFDLTDSIRTIIARINVLTSKNGYSIQFHADSHLFVHADQARMQQVTYNLIGNALTYTGADKTVHVTLKQQETMAHVDITDSGKGIAPDEIDRIWNRYYRTRESHKRAVIGSGLGLHIVQSILEEHHFPYGVRSRLEHGTTFWFEVPIVPEPSPDPAVSRH